MIGGRDYVDSIYNRATQAERQPGSAFKLFVYLAALESGMKPTDTIVDEPVTIDGWTPRNSTRTHVGPVSLREAFARSINTVSAKIGAQLGFGTIADMARRFGISSNISTYPVDGARNERRPPDRHDARLRLGRQPGRVGRRPMRSARSSPPTASCSTRRTARKGRVLVAPWVAAEMTDLLQSAVLTGTGRAAQIGRPVAGKTGTTSSNKDGWFIGFSSGLTTGVWMGRDDARRDRRAAGRHCPGPRLPRFHGTSPSRAGRSRTSRPKCRCPTGTSAPRKTSTRNEVAFEPLVDENRQSTSGAAARSRCRQAPDQQPQQPHRQPTTGQLDQQWLDQVLPPGSARSVRSLSASRRSGRRSSGLRRRPHRVRPIRFSRPPIRRSNSRAASASPSNSLRSSALNAGPWSMWTRCATSCATT